MSTLLLLLFLHGLFLTLVLGSYGRQQHPANGVLAALTLATSLLLLDSYLVYSGATQRWPHLAGTLLPVWFLIGPLTYIYTRRFLNHPRQKQELIYAIPALAAIVWLMPFYVQTAQAKLVAQPTSEETFAFYSFFWMLTAWCAFRSNRVIRQSQDEGKPEATEKPWHSAWLRWLMGALMAYAILDFSATFLFFLLGYYPAVLGLISLILLTAITYSVGLLVVIPDGLLAHNHWPGKRYQRSEMPTEAARQLAAELQELMIRDKLWLNDAMSQSELANRLGISSHQLSQLLNQHIGLSFTDYLNRYRIEEAKRLLRDIGSRKSILDIGMEAGFGSSATFYRAFKKYAGTTPKQFLADAATSNVEPHPAQKQSD